jgi:hypothetical protein
MVAPRLTAVEDSRDWEEQKDGVPLPRDLLHGETRTGGGRPRPFTDVPLSSQEQEKLVRWVGDPDPLPMHC